MGESSRLGYNPCQSPGLMSRTGQGNRDPMEERIRQRIRYLRTPDNVQLAWAEAGTGPVLIKAANWLTPFDKLGVWTRAQAMVFARVRGFGERPR